MATNDQKSPSRVWVETLTPIILALIGIVVPMTTVILDKCNRRNGPANEQVVNSTPTSTPQPAKTPVKNEDPKPVSTSMKETPKPKEDLIKFSGKVTGADGLTGIAGVKINYLGKEATSGFGGKFEIDVPKNANYLVLNTHYRGFKPQSPEFNLKRDNGKALIRLIPE